MMNHELINKIESLKIMLVSHATGGSGDRHGIQEPASRTHGRSTHLPLGEGTGDEGAQLALPPEAITAAVSGIGHVSPAGETAWVQ
jgi:hypothetical protein